MSRPTELTAGRYAVTVPARSDKAFTEWRTANKARVGIREVRQSSDYFEPAPSAYPALFTVPLEPAGIATYEIEVTPGPALPVPVIDGGGFDSLGKPGGPQSVDDYTPTSSPEYHANEVPELTPTKVVTAGAIVVGVLLGVAFLWKRFFSPLP